MNPSDFSSSFFPDFMLGTYADHYGGCGSTDQMRSLLFHRLLYAMPCIANIPLSLRRRVLRGCLFRFFTASVAFAIADRRGALFFPFPG